MLKINTNFKKVRIPLVLGVLGLSGAFLFQYLTFIPEYSSAESISTTDPVRLPEIDGTITTKFGTEEQGYKTYMQEIDLSYCQSLPNGTTGQLADGRDGKIYWVTVLGADATKTCWMTQDLDYDLDGQALTTKNSDSDYLRGSDADWSGRMADGSLIPSSSGGWTTTNERALNWFDRNSIHGTEHNSLGNLYSYQSVSANTGSVDSGIVSGSICPAGWKLPLSNSTALGSFASLQNAGMSSNILANGSPYFFQYGGYIGSYLRDVSRNGHYWSASVLSSSIIYYLYFTVNGDFNPTDGGGYRHNGFAARCVIRDPNYTAPIMPTPSEPNLNNPNLSVTVDKILTMKLDSNEVNIEPKNGEIMTGDFGATVSSNADYTLSITAAEGASTSLVNQNDNIVIAEIPTITSVTSSLTPNENNWAIRLCNDESKTNCNNYKPITPYGTTNIFLTNGTPASNATSLFEVGIGISPALPSGTYSTNILVTASQK